MPVLISGWDSLEVSPRKALAVVDTVAESEKLHSDLREDNADVDTMRGAARRLVPPDYLRQRLAPMLVRPLVHECTEEIDEEAWSSPSYQPDGLGSKELGEDQSDQTVLPDASTPVGHTSEQRLPCTKVRKCDAASRMSVAWSPEKS